MTQQELAHAAGLPQPTIARIERGTVTPRTATLIKILQASGHRLTIEPISASADREAIRKRLAMSVPRRAREALGKPNTDPRSGPLHIVKRLRRFGVPFVLIGDLAEVAHGSPTEPDRLIEVCMASTSVARERLRLALDDLGDEAKSGLRVLTETAAGDAYEVLNRNAVAMHVDAGILVRVAGLEDLIRIRRARQDEAAESILRAIDDEALKLPER